MQHSYISITLVIVFNLTTLFDFVLLLSSIMLKITLFNGAIISGFIDIINECKYFHHYNFWNGTMFF